MVFFLGASGKQGTSDTGEGMIQTNWTVGFLNIEGSNCLVGLFGSLLLDECKSSVSTRVAFYSAIFVRVNVFPIFLPERSVWKCKNKFWDV